MASRKNTCTSQVLIIANESFPKGGRSGTIDLCKNLAGLLEAKPGFKVTLKTNLSEREVKAACYQMMMAGKLDRMTRALWLIISTDKKMNLSFEASKDENGKFIQKVRHDYDLWVSDGRWMDVESLYYTELRNGPPYWVFALIAVM
jgi:hypothetical protein